MAEEHQGSDHEQALQETWAIVELMGHRKRAGIVSETTVAGKPMIRVDVPVDGGSDTVTEFYSGDALYAIRPCTEAVAREAVKNYGMDPRPVAPVNFRIPDETRRVSHYDEDEEIPI